MKGYVINVKTGEVKYVEDDTPLPKPTTPPKLYRIFKTISLATGKKVKIFLSRPVRLTSQEIEEIKNLGFEIEEIMLT